MIRTVLITGCSSGIGQATADLFFERGWNVAATQRKPAGRRDDARWFEQALDVNDGASVSTAVAAAIERFGRIDALVNNAGYSLVGTFESATEAQVRRQFETNVFGLMRTTRAVLPHFREMKGGVVVNVSSMGGRLTFPFYSVYHASKWAVDGYSESLAFELAPLSIRVKVIEPGAIKTDFYERSADFVHDRSLDAYNAIVDKGMAKMKQAGEKGAPPSKVANAIWKAVHDTSSKLRYVVGADAKSLLAMRRIAGEDAYRAIIAKQLLK